MTMYMYMYMYTCTYVCINMGIYMQNVRVCVYMCIKSVCLGAADYTCVQQQNDVCVYVTHTHINTCTHGARTSESHWLRVVC